MKSLNELEQLADESIKLLLKGLNPSKAKKTQLLNIMKLTGFISEGVVEALSIPEISKTQVLDKFGATYSSQVLPLVKQLIDSKRCKLLLTQKQEEAKDINSVLEKDSRTTNELIKIKDAVIEKVLSVDSTKEDVIKIREQVKALREQQNLNREKLNDIVQNIKLAARQELRIKGLID